jgi:hypothetical protein
MRKCRVGCAAACVVTTSMTLDARGEPVERPAVTAQASRPEAVVPIEPSGQRLPPPARGAAWSERRLALEGHFGMATPVGLAGITVEYSPLPVLALGAGIGTNFLGPEPAALVRVRPLDGVRDALVVSAAYSVGPYGFKPISIDGSAGSGKGYWHANALQWVQGDIGWEHRSRKGLVIRIGLGLAYVVNRGALECVRGEFGCDESSKPDHLLTFDFGLGYAFPNCCGQRR